jgi:polyhydroxyalkanoate synthase
VKHSVFGHDVLVSPQSEGREIDDLSGSGFQREGEGQLVIDPAHRAVGDLDGFVRSAFARATAGRSPLSLWLAWLDWGGHLSIAPALRLRLIEAGLKQAARLADYALDCAMGRPRGGPCVTPAPQDKRFVDPLWSRWPFDLIHQSFLLQQAWWEAATSTVPGVSRHSAQQMAFVTRQMLDVLSPSNFVATNPVVLKRTLETNGKNLADGAANLFDDMKRSLTGAPPFGVEKYKVGETIACTPGRVVFRNELIELIQYAPTTRTVYPEPILIVPAWIMKYYVLDLSPENSLIRHLVEAGHTVFAISWRNPSSAQRDLGMDDYLSLGIDAGVSAVRRIVPENLIHAVGYCLGGTLLAIKAAALGKDFSNPFKSVTLLAAQTDFADAGELTLFVDESQVTFLEDAMAQEGFLKAAQMAGAFQLLRSNDLVWSRWIRDYLLGERTKLSDLMVWNSDATRMPYRMHSEYLRRLFLHNDLAAGRYMVRGTPVGLSNIDVPVFAVGTEWDHVAPWESVYKIHLQVQSEVTFVLTTGGHNAGIVNPPSAPGRSYRMGTQTDTARFLSAQRWRDVHNSIDGSWWPAWVSWLARHCSPRRAPPEIGAPDQDLAAMEAAPGTYVFEQ